MTDRSPYCHALKFDKPIRIATDNVAGYVISPEYNPIIPPVEGYFLLTDSTPFLLTDGENLDLA